jgi:hypothetical protein
MNSVVDIKAGAVVVAQSGTIHNDGALLVSGRLEPRGTMTGAGRIRVEPLGQLGVFGQFPTDTFTTSTDVNMDAFSTFEVLLTPNSGDSQKLVANGLFTLGGTGVFLNPLVIPATDVVLAPGTKFVIVDYQDGNLLQGRFKRSDNSLILEGDFITAGLNTFSVSYNDGGNSSAITLTVVPDTHPLAGADAVDRYPSQSVKVSVATLLSNDIDPATGTNAGLSITAVNNPGASPATVTLSGDTVFYSPNGHLTADTFEYTVQNSAGETATGTVTVSLIVDNDPAENVIRFKVLPGGSTETVFGGIPGRTYRIQTSENLINWTDRATVVADGVGRVMFTDTSSSPSRFYRTVSP